MFLRNTVRRHSTEASVLLTLEVSAGSTACSSRNEFCVRARIWPAPGTVPPFHMFVSTGRGCDRLGSLSTASQGSARSDLRPQIKNAKSAVVIMLSAVPASWTLPQQLLT